MKFRKKHIVEIPFSSMYYKLQPNIN